MLLEPLVSTIETIKSRIATHGPTLRENEIRTRMALIDPLLQALGWDVSDPEMVTPEYSVGNGRADYALLGQTKNPIAFIEAKHLGEPLERPQHEDQLFTYALRQQVKFAALTDGNRWILDDVSVFTGGERRLLQVSIADTPAHESALKLLLLWRPNLVSGQPVAANEPVLDLPQKQPDVAEPSVPTPFVSPKAPVVQAAQSEPVPSNDVSAEAVWMPLSNISHASVDRKPVAVKFPGTAPVLCKSWRQILVQTTEWLCKEERLTGQQCPISKDGTGIRRFLVSTNPIHKNGQDFTEPHETSTGLFLEINHSARSCVELAKLLLNKLGVSPEVVELRFE